MGGDFQSTNLDLLFEQVKEDLSEELKQGNIMIESHDIGNITIIPYQFKQIFHNLLSNSIKFSHPGRPLHIKILNELVKGEDVENVDLKKNKTYCHIRFSDNGIGFDQQYSDKIFELFQRLHGKSEYPGTGIGLAIIKRIIENHDGTITAGGKAGEGATFDLYVPAER
jgi:signal transduction histidine kinase